MPARKVNFQSVALAVRSALSAIVVVPSTGCERADVVLAAPKLVTVVPLM